MGFLAPAMPWIVQGAGALYGYLSNRSASKKANAERGTALAGAQGTADWLGQEGTSLTNQGRGGLGKAQGYWETLMHGNRAQMAQATAAPAGAIRDLYRGAERGIDRAGIRGGSRDMAFADLARERAGKIAGLTTGVQAQAAQGLAETSTPMLAAGTGLRLGAGNLWSNLLAQGSARVNQVDANGRANGAAVGQMLSDMMKNWPKSGAKPIPSHPIPTTPAPAPTIPKTPLWQRLIPPLGGGPRGPVSEATPPSGGGGGGELPPLSSSVFPTSPAQAPTIPQPSVSTSEVATLPMQMPDGRTVYATQIWPEAEYYRDEEGNLFTADGTFVGNYQGSPT